MILQRLLIWILWLCNFILLIFLNLWSMLSILIITSPVFLIVRLLEKLQFLINIFEKLVNIFIKCSSATWTVGLWSFDDFGFDPSLHAFMVEQMVAYVNLSDIQILVTAVLLKKSFQTYGACLFFVSEIAKIHRLEENLNFVHVSFLFFLHEFCLPD